MTQRMQVGGLRVAKELYDFVTEEAIPGTGIEAEDFWRGLEQILGDLSAENKVLLEERDRMQAAIDAWHQTHAGQPADPAAYRRFLEEIGYLLPEGEDFTVATTDVDAEISKVAGPQLVVPITNARYALNAANARWGSLYDALYGSNVIAESEGAEIGGDYNPSRGARVIERVMAFLDRTVPLSEGSHDAVAGYRPAGQKLELVLADGRSTRLIREEDFAGYQGPEEAPTAILLRHHGLHIELQIDPRHPIGKYHPGGIKDVILEAAVTTIQDCEDSVATVDADDKTAAYRNWLGLMKGNLSASFQKAGKTIHRHLAPDRKYTAPDGTTLCLPGRSLLFLRNVGHLMTSDAVIDRNGDEIPEGILDGMVSCLIGIHDLKGKRELRNSRSGSLYIVKPKMHGPREVAFADRLFERIEDALGLQRCTIKMGIMDEERRTSVNLKECIRAARNRIVFINTGFLDRTGDEIHTSMEAGPMVRKTEMKHQRWIQAYEDRNVDVGLSCGLAGRAQIGKGMWPMPDEMRQMMKTKGDHPRAGANTAWVPSPTAAVLHAMHYHEVDVAARQAQLAKRPRARLEDMLTLPLLGETPLSEEEIEQELSNNIQGILGYVVRWVEQGVGCSTVPDINDIGLMEDRATLRISSQHIANWLRHGICSEEQVREILRRMAAMVDKQNAGDPNYRNMAPRFEQSAAFQAASDLIFLGSQQPNGYTEPLLHSHRRAVKAPAR